MNKQLHKQFRLNFNSICLKRDRYKCKLCKKIEDLDVHHIIDRHDMPNGGYASSNGITLCKMCHLAAETCNYPDAFTLYKLNNTTFEQSYIDCENLLKD